MPLFLPALLLSAILGLAASVAARAGDAASLEILGFSPDGSIFAFEEYGVQDGSGFPYANRFFIDTATDGFVPGTPVRVLLEQDGASLEDARAQARLETQAIVADAVLAAHRGLLAGHNPIGELSADPHRIVVNSRLVVPPIDPPLEFRIAEIPVPEPETCQNLGTIVAGFRLTRIEAAEGGVTRLLHEDASLPASRGCALGYAIGGVQTFHPEGGPPVFALMIAIRRLGFEGPDFRWIAVTGRI